MPSAHFSLGRSLVVGLCACVVTGCPAPGSRGSAGSIPADLPISKPVHALPEQGGSQVAALGPVDRDVHALRAVGQSIFHAAQRDQATLERWLENPESALWPLVPADASGVPAAFRSPDCCLKDPHVLSCTTSLSSGARLYYTDSDGKSINCRVGDFGVPRPPAGVRKTAGGGGNVPIIDHLKTLPASANIVHGIAWAFVELPDLSQTQAGALRHQLGLVIPPATLGALRTGYGEPTLLKNQQGDLCLTFGHAGVDYYVLIERFHVVLEDGLQVRVPGIPERSDGIVKRIRIVGAQDPDAVLRAWSLETGGPSASQWTLISEGWANL